MKKWGNGLIASDTGVMLTWYGMFLTDLTDLDDPTQAESLLRRALNIETTAFPDGHWQVVCVQMALARCLVAQSRVEEAKDILEETNTTLSWLSDADRRQALNRVLPLFEQWGWGTRAETIQSLLASVSPSARQP